MASREMTETLRNRNPLTASPDSTVQAACRQMHDQRVGSVVVTDVAVRPVGIFTGRDAVSCLAKQLHPEKVLLPDVMTRDPQTLVPGRTAIEALRLIHDGGFRHIPVVENGAVIGVVSRGDFRGIEQDRLDEETGIWERL